MRNINRNAGYRFVMILVILALFVVFPVTGRLEQAPKLKVAVLAGVTGLAMLPMVAETPIGDAYFQFEIFRSPDPVLGKLITGEIDIAGLPTNAAAILYNKGVGIQLTSIIGWGVMYVVGKNGAVKDWKDLKEKEVYVASKGAVSDLLFQYLCMKNGLKSEDVKIQYVANAAELAQLAAVGKVALAALPEPWVTTAMEKNEELKVLLDYQREWQRVEKQEKTYPQTCVVVRKETALKYPEKVKEFLKRLEEGILWVNSDPETAGPLAEKYLQVPATVLPKALDRCNLKYADGFKTQKEVDQFLQRLLELAPEAVGGKIPDAKFYYQP